jgi:NTE family protein
MAVVTSAIGEGSGAGGPGLVLTGGGARAAYQVGFLRCLARHMPDARIPFITGVSAGAINATFLAQHPGTFAEAVEDLVRLWDGLSSDKVFRVGSWTLAKTVVRWGLRLVSGGGPGRPEVQGFLDTSPLRELLDDSLPRAVDGSIRGIAENLADPRRALRAVALTGLKYSTGQTVTWVQGQDIATWERPHRLAVHTELRVEHVMASSALPVIFPAQKVGDAWYGDGGVRLATPLSPAIHLGADRILAISTRYARSVAEASSPAVAGYPPPAQVAGVLLNAIFLDAVDMDALRLERINRLLDRCPNPNPENLRPVELMVLRPSQDLGRLAADYERRLPKGFRFLIRGTGTRETASPDILSLLLFEAPYLKRLIGIGEADAETRIGEIERLLGG